MSTPFERVYFETHLPFIVELANAPDFPQGNIPVGNAEDEGIITFQLEDAFWDSESIIYKKLDQCQTENFKSLPSLYPRIQRVCKDIFHTYAVENAPDISTNLTKHLISLNKMAEKSIQLRTVFLRSQNPPEGGKVPEKAGDTRGSKRGRESASSEGGIKEERPPSPISGKKHPNEAPEKENESVKKQKELNSAYAIALDLICERRFDALRENLFANPEQYGPLLNDLKENLTVVRQNQNAFKEAEWAELNCLYEFILVMRSNMQIESTIGQKRSHASNAGEPEEQKSPYESGPIEEPTVVIQIEESQAEELRCAIKASLKQEQDLITQGHIEEAITVIKGNRYTKELLQMLREILDAAWVELSEMEKVEGFPMDTLEELIKQLNALDEVLASKEPIPPMSPGLLSLYRSKNDAKTIIEKASYLTLLLWNWENANISKSPSNTSILEDNAWLSSTIEQQQSISEKSLTSPLDDLSRFSLNELEALLFHRQLSDSEQDKCFSAYLKQQGEDGKEAISYFFYVLAKLEAWPQFFSYLHVEAIPCEYIVGAFDKLAQENDVSALTEILARHIPYTERGNKLIDLLSRSSFLSKNQTLFAKWKEMYSEVKAHREGPSGPATS